MAQRVIELIGVYHAEGSLLGELRYVFGKLTGTAHCALCDITHAGVREKPAFRRGCGGLPVPFARLHLDERDVALRDATEGKTPCVLARTEGGLTIVLDAGALAGCGGDEARFFDALEASLAASGLTLAGT